jgi:hypothetical protein
MLLGFPKRRAAATQTLSRRARRQIDRGIAEHIALLRMTTRNLGI